MTSYTRARAERQLARLEIGWMERGERFVVLIVGAILGFLEVALWIVALGATATTLQRVFAARRLLRELDATGRDPTAGPDAKAVGG
jgi:CDP-diacylglycerol--glycerol-3-phosphate 3-phosphatidyltransferase